MPANHSTPDKSGWTPILRRTRYPTRSNIRSDIRRTSSAVFTDISSLCRIFHTPFYDIVNHNKGFYRPQQYHNAQGLLDYISPVRHGYRKNIDHKKYYGYYDREYRKCTEYEVATGVVHSVRLAVEVCYLHVDVVNHPMQGIEQCVLADMLLYCVCNC